MNFWGFIVIVVIAGYLYDFFVIREKNKKQHIENREDVELLSKQIEKLKKRIQNLETIAANEPDEFSQSSADEEFRTERESPMESEHQNQVASMAERKRRNRQ